MQNSPSDENDNGGDDCGKEDKAAKDAQGDDSPCKEGEVSCQYCTHCHDRSSQTDIHKMLHVSLVATYGSFAKFVCCPELSSPKSGTMDASREYITQCQCNRQNNFPNLSLLSLALLCPREILERVQFAL